MGNSETVVMCILGEGEMCSSSCPRMNVCWPEYQEENVSAKKDK